MNIRKPVDFSEMYLSLDMAVAGKYAQMQMYAMIGQAVTTREEKELLLLPQIIYRCVTQICLDSLLAISAGCVNFTAPTLRTKRYCIWQCRLGGRRTLSSWKPTLPWRNAAGT